MIPKSPDDIQKCLLAMEKQLLDPSLRISFSSTRSNHKHVPNFAGVYALFEDDQIIYVGETGSLQGRCKDLCDTRNHSLRRSIGRSRFPNLSPEEQASSARKFAASKEQQLNDWMETNLTIAYLPVLFGRKELEEFIYERNPVKYNSRGRR